MRNIEFQGRCERAGEPRLIERVVLEGDLLRRSAEMVCEKNTSERAAEDAALAVDREVKPCSTRSFFGGENTTQLIEAGFATINARAPDMHLIGSEHMISARRQPLLRIHSSVHRLV
jgi:hypothetical protein